MSEFFDNGKLSRLVAYTPGEQPADMDRLIKLNTNESPFEPSPAVLKAVDCDAVRRLRLYSDPECGKLIEALSRCYGLPENMIFVGNGSDEVLAFCFHGLCANGAAFADITYGFYPVFCNMFSTAAKIVPLREDFSISVSDYEGLPQTVFIANPNAPTGIALPLCDIERLLSQNPERLVVVDEAYVDFGAQSALALLKRYRNLLVVRTFSKSRNLAGGRIGYAFGDAQLIADLNKLRYSFNPYNVNSLSQLAATAALDDTEYFEYCRREIIDSRRQLTEGLRGMGFAVTDSSANFVFAACPCLSGTELYHKLREKGILVRHFAVDRIDNYVRITVGMRQQTVKLLQAVAEILKEL